MSILLDEEEVGGVWDAVRVVPGDADGDLVGEVVSQQLGPFLQAEVVEQLCLEDEESLDVAVSLVVGERR
ncbi:hypothetical protein ACFPM0_23815 [Pseudonocardia sulfidoxydans]|uniref:hypothetical protein n=1 Tax=Pseudonocardia sulfidoxydans TaxID=54011 RepID=UPI003618F632